MPPPFRSSDIYVKEDIRNILRSLLLAHELSTRQQMSPQTEQFRSGFVSAISAVAVAMDISLGIGQTRSNDTHGYLSG